MVDLFVFKAHTLWTWNWTWILHEIQIGSRSTGHKMCSFDNLLVKINQNSSGTREALKWQSWRLVVISISIFWQVIWSPCYPPHITSHVRSFSCLHIKMVAQSTREIHPRHHSISFNKGTAKKLCKLRKIATFPILSAELLSKRASLYLK